MEIKLRKFDDADISLFQGWLSKPYVAKWYRQDVWLEELNNRKQRFAFIHHFIVEADTVPIGFCQYYKYALGREDWHNGIDIKDTYSIDYLIGEEEYLGKHYAPKIIKELEAVMNDESDCKKIIVQPEKENIISRQTLLSSGYLYDDKNDIFYKLTKNAV